MSDLVAQARKWLDGDTPLMVYEKGYSSSQCVADSYLFTGGQLIKDMVDEIERLTAELKQWERCEGFMPGACTNLKCHEERLDRIFENLRKLTTRYRKALEFYADPETYDLCITVGPVGEECPIEKDNYGDKARKALEN